MEIITECKLKLSQNIREGVNSPHNTVQITYNKNTQQIYVDPVFLHHLNTIGIIPEDLFQIALVFKTAYDQIKDLIENGEVK